MIAANFTFETVQYTGLKGWKTTLRINQVNKLDMYKHA